MKKAFLPLLIASSALLNGQNLVQNGGFEPNDCANPGIDWHLVVPEWTDPFSTVDHYGPCTFTGSATTNNNLPPRTGQGNIGLAVYGFNIGPGEFNREYALGQLTRTLEEGVTYRISYFVRPIYVNSSGINAGIEGPGFAFYSNAGGLVPDNQMLVDDPNAIHPDYVIDNRNSWTQVCTTYTATGTERYIALGSFKPDDELNAVPLENSGMAQGYYLIDDLTVEELGPRILPASMEWCDGDVFRLTVNDTMTGTWDNGSTETFRDIDRPGTYTYGYQDGICYRVETIQVDEVNCQECYIYIPSAFSPNGDGKNDGWRPIFDCPTLEYRLEIYDRIGNLVFETTDELAEWSPTEAGALDTYVARLRMTYEYYGERTYVDRTTYVTVIQ